jgi:chemotaxis protein histidine kinase CheA
MAGAREDSEFLETFKAEADEYLNKLDRGLLALEKNPSDTEILYELFRVAHTLKGAASMMGFTDIKEIAHRMEDLFGLVHSKQREFQSEMASVVFTGVDAIRAILSTVIGAVPGTGPSVNVAEICRQLEAAAKTGGAASGIPSPGRPVAEPSSATPNAPDASGTGGVSTPAASREPAPAVSTIDESIRIPLARVNKLLNLVGELVINKVKSSHKSALIRALNRTSVELQARFESLSAHLREAERDTRLHDTGRKLMHDCSLGMHAFRRELLALSDTITNEMLQIDPVIEELQRRMKDIRMLPCTQLFEQLSRVARDVARSMQKDVVFVVQGGETELDKKVLEEIKGPLIHLLRNSIDHGIETAEERAAAGKPPEGRIEIAAEQAGDHVVITVTDDGRGINPDRVKATAIRKGLIRTEDAHALTESDLFGLIFTKGFSTSEIITDISGRGVGLDVVRTQMEALKGQVSVTSEVGHGTTFRLELPLTIALIHALLVHAHDEVLAFPLTAVEESMKVAERECVLVDMKMAVNVRNHLVPLVRLGQLLGMEADSASAAGPGRDSDGTISIVIISSMGKRVGFIVDKILGDQEIYVKHLGAHVGKVRNISGATVLGTGEMVLILDVADLMRSAQDSRRTVASAPAPQMERTRRRILVVEDSLTTRELERGMLESRGFIVETASDGLEALEKLAQGSFDLVLSDVEMPRMNGFDLCRALRANDNMKNIPLVFVTTLEKESDKRKGIEVGAQAYIVKNAFHEGNLLQTINQLVSN